jgi:hypothetical protein
MDYSGYFLLDNGCPGPGKANSGSRSPGQAALLGQIGEQVPRRLFLETRRLDRNLAAGDCLYADQASGTDEIG